METPKPGTFCWNECIIPDPNRAAGFYGSLFGWQTEAMPGGGDYTLFKQGSGLVGGLMAPPEPGIPPHWLCYVCVEDCEAAVQRAVQLGGAVVAPPMVISVGTIAIIRDPQGAVLGLYTPAGE